MDLAPFDQADLTALRWNRVDGPSTMFRLGSDETLVATLTWRKPHGSLADGVTAGNRWTLKREGFLRAHLTVREEGNRRDVARLVTAWRDHRIELREGTAFDLRRASILVPEWTVTDASDGSAVARIEPVREGRRLEGGICEVSPTGRARSTLPLLLILSWYFVVLAWFEDETVAEWSDHAEGRF